MWTSTNFKTYQKQFDFTSSEQGKPVYTALKIDDKDFINIVEELDGVIEDNQIFQAIICDYCGTYQCASGNWMAVRQVAKFIFFIPAFEQIQEEPDRGEYDPPYLLSQKGAYWLTIEEFNNFKKLVPELDKLKSINQLTKFELLSLYKWDTPYRMFGDFPNFEALRKNHVLAVSDFDNETIFEILDRKLNLLEASTEFEISLLTEKDEVISVFLDDSSSTEWQVLCKTENNYDLVLGGTFKILVK